MPRRWDRQPQRLSLGERVIALAVVLGILVFCWACYTLVVVVAGAPH